jgi:hypothetical protein
LTTTALQTIQTANASSSAGIESQRLRCAIASPRLFQKLSSSGRQSTRTGPAAGIVWTVMLPPGSWAEL